MSPSARILVWGSKTKTYFPKQCILFQLLFNSREQNRSCALPGSITPASSASLTSKTMMFQSLSPILNEAACKYIVPAMASRWCLKISFGFRAVPLGNTRILLASRDVVTINSYPGMNSMRWTCSLSVSSNTAPDGECTRVLVMSRWDAGRTKPWEWAERHLDAMCLRIRQV